MAQRLKKFLIAFAIIGLTWRLGAPPYDPLLQCLGFIGLSVFYSISGYFLILPKALLENVPEGHLGVTKNIRIAAILYGLLSGYIVATALLFTLGWLGLWTFAGLVFPMGIVALQVTLMWYSRKRNPIIRYMTKRLAILMVCCLILIPLQIAWLQQPVLNYLNPFGK